MPACRVVFACLLVVSVTGCNAYKEGLLERAGGPGRLPLRPDPVDGGQNDSAELVYALHNVLLNQTAPVGETQPWASIGLNLDDRNTRSDSDPNQMCRRPDSNGAYPRLDGVNGIDNMLGSTLWPNIGQFVGGSMGAEVFETQMNDGFEAGRGTIILRITKWNGTANDDEVEVWLFPAAAGTSSPAGAVQFTPGTNNLVLTANPSVAASPPVWDGSAESGWYGNKMSFADGNDPSPRMPDVRDLNGYIANGVLVMAMAPDDILELRVANFASVAVQLSGANIVASLSEDFSRVESGFIAGRFSLDNLFEVGGSVGICGPLRAQVSTLFDKMADVLADPTLEGGPSAVCDAVSVGVAFQAVRGTYRGVGPEPLCMPDTCAGFACED